MNPTKNQIAHAVGRMSILRYFPSTDAAQMEIMRLLERLCGTGQELEWLVTTMVDRVGEWKGPAELRGVFCTRFRPSDGVEMDCRDTIGFTPADFETRTLLGHEQLKALPAANAPAKLAKQLEAVKKL